MSNRYRKTKIAVGTFVIFGICYLLFANGGEEIHFLVSNNLSLAEKSTINTFDVSTVPALMKIKLGKESATIHFVFNGEYDNGTKVEKEWVVKHQSGSEFGTFDLYNHVKGILEQKGTGGVTFGLMIPGEYKVKAYKEGELIGEGGFKVKAE
ncbi:hypothetical protein [Brevibacillus reuszeri]|uniref:hypothetical protein n=1 Tax=Brevibacillus reuszeri TaxID=54915 RepID=UPI003D20AA14